MSHYCEPGARTRGRGQYEDTRTVCQQWTPSRLATAEPTCAACRAWIEKDARETAAILAQWDAVRKAHA